MKSKKTISPIKEGLEWLHNLGTLDTTVDLEKKDMKAKGKEVLQATNIGFPGARSTPKH